MKKRKKRRSKTKGGDKLPFDDEMGKNQKAVKVLQRLFDAEYGTEKEIVNMTVDQHIIIWHFRRIKLCRNNAGIFHPRTPGILVITVIEKIITVITRLKMGYFNFPDSANYGIK